MTSSTDRAADPHASPAAPYERALKIAVVVMGIMIVVGVLAVIARIVYLASSPKPGTPSAVAASGRIATAAKLALPGGASIRHMTLSGDRLAVHFEAASGAGIAILDLATGNVLSRIDIVPEAPR